MDKFGERIKVIRLQRDKTLEDVAKAIGVSRQTIQRYETGVINNVPSDKIEAIADYLNIEPSFLMGWNDTSADAPCQYPYISDAVAAGMPCTIEGIKELPTIGISDAIMGKYAGNKHIIIMRVNGESMNKLIPSGSFIAVKTDVSVNQLKDGDLVVFGKEHQYSLKHYYDAGDEVIFKPNSTEPRFRDHVYRKDETVTIVGKVVMYMVGLQ